MANLLDEETGPIREEGKDVNVIAKQIPVKVGVGSTIFEIVLWVCGIIPGLIFLIKKIKAGTYLRQLEQKIQHDASQIDNYLEQRVVILSNLARLVDKAVTLDKETFTAIAEARAGKHVTDGDEMANEAAKTMLTYAGLKRYEEELHELKVVKRQEVAEKIKVAREQGDLSENADYDAAKEEQTEIEVRIAQLETLLKNAEVVKDDEYVAGKINVGCFVKLFDMEYDEEVEYHIVGSSEANSLEGKISNESPVGAALMGHTVNETVEVKLPDGGINEYKILDVRKIDD